MNSDIQSCASCGRTVDQVSLWTYRGETKCEACFNRAIQHETNFQKVLAEFRRNRPRAARRFVLSLAVLVVILIIQIGIDGREYFVKRSVSGIIVWAVVTLFFYRLDRHTSHETLRKLR